MNLCRRDESVSRLCSAEVDADDDFGNLLLRRNSGQQEFRRIVGETSVNRALGSDPFAEYQAVVVNRPLLLFGEIPDELRREERVVEYRVLLAVDVSV